MEKINYTKNSLIFATILLVVCSLLTTTLLFSANIKPLFKSNNGFSVKYDLKK